MSLPPLGCGGCAASGRPRPARRDGRGRTTTPERALLAGQVGAHRARSWRPAVLDGNGGTLQRAPSAKALATTAPGTPISHPGKPGRVAVEQSQVSALVRDRRCDGARPVAQHDDADEGLFRVGNRSPTTAAVTPAAAVVGTGCGDGEEDSGMVGSRFRSFVNVHFAWMIMSADAHAKSGYCRWSRSRAGWASARGGRAAHWRAHGPVRCLPGPPVLSGRRGTTTRMPQASLLVGRPAELVVC
jgi:hypothetical protein